PAESVDASDARASDVVPPEAGASSPDAAVNTEGTAASDTSVAPPLAEGFASEAESFSRGELTRFAATAIAIQPVLANVESRLQAAQSVEERQDIEREFDLEATRIIEANGLSPETYQAIARVAQSDDSVRRAVTAAAERLQGG
ncbi:MAG: DUF4168 domain-containing protein, partial [Cyanobacteria bacterium J06639_1]